jgi:hypothetical protein
MAIGLLLFCLLLELATRLGFARISRLESRVAASDRAAKAIRPGHPPPSVLLLGNSLALEGIDTPGLQTTLANSARIVPFFVEGTSYIDWYFGIRRLFHEGSRPDLIVLCLNTSQLVDSSIRGDYSAYYLFDVRDLPQIRKSTNASLTVVSSLLLARYSLFYAGRASLRNFLLGRIDYRYADLLHRLAQHPLPPPSIAAIQKIGAERLKALEALCKDQGARFMFLLPPGGRRHADVLADAATGADVRLAVPIAEGALGPEMFRDGFHLNQAGRTLFTKRLADVLSAELTRSESR